MKVDIPNTFSYGSESVLEQSEQSTGQRLFGVLVLVSIPKYYTFSFISRIY